MKNLTFLRLFLAAMAAMLILASCSSDDEAAAPDTTVAESADDSASGGAEADEVETTEQTEVDDEAAAEPADDAPTTTVDTRTDLEIATDNLDVTSFQLGVEDLEGAANCVIDRLEEEGIPFTGEGTAELIALIRCEPDTITQWLPDSNPVLVGNDWNCTVRQIGEWLSARTIPEAEEFLGAGAPPQEFFDLAAQNCNLDVNDVAAALS